MFNSGYSGQINNNTNYGLSLTVESCSQYHTRNTFSGNGSGPADDLHITWGGATYP